MNTGTLHTTPQGPFRARRLLVPPGLQASVMSFCAMVRRLRRELRRILSSRSVRRNLRLKYGIGPMWPHDWRFVHTRRTWCASQERGRLSGYHASRCRDA